MAGESPFTIQWLGYEALKRYTKNMPGNRDMKAVKDIRFLARRCKARGCWAVMTSPIKYVLEDNDFIKIESWLNDDNINIQLAGYTMYRLDRTAAPDIHALWPHPGQIEVARRFRTLLDSDHHPSEIAVLAMELLAACQGIELFHPLLTTTPLEKVYDLVPQCNQSPG
ncbi:uncharacterized protein ACWYII_000907 isoform 2-T8 [Salvelinus alpinus]